MGKGRLSGNLSALLRRGLLKFKKCGPFYQFMFIILFSFNILREGAVLTSILVTLLVII